MVWVVRQSKRGGVGRRAGRKKEETYEEQGDGGVGQVEDEEFD